MEAGDGGEAGISRSHAVLSPPDDAALRDSDVSARAARPLFVSRVNRTEDFP